MNIKKIGKYLLLVMIIPAILAGCGSVDQDVKSASSSDQNDKVYEFDFNGPTPSTHPYFEKVVNPWAEFVEQETEGRVKINVYSSAALGSTNTAYEDIEGGVYDIGFVSPGFQGDTDLFPLTILELPFAVSNPEEYQKIAKKYNDEYMSESFENSIILGFGSTDANQLYSKEPVETIKDVKSQKIVTMGAEKTKVVEEWGGTPVSLGVEQIYESLERNMIDQALYNGTGAIGIKMFEVAPNLTKVDMGVASIIHIMNKDSFNKMPEDLQKKFTEVLGPKLEELTVELYQSQAENAITEFENIVKDKGGKVTIPSEAELLKFKKASKGVWDEWIKDANKKGYPGEEMMESFKKLLTEEGIQVPFK
nr:TRAP transporter substrate-binding protein DctP [Fredinandcohnia onubensis]